MSEQGKPEWAALHLELQGNVQGCGVRPALVLLARSLHLAGWVANEADRVCVHVQGPRAQVWRFRDDIPGALPAQARLDRLVQVEADIDASISDFVIARDAFGANTVDIPQLPADRALCDECRQELSDPQSRRYQWPFIACTSCGPRFAWLKQLPFLRGNTTFAGFHACDSCSREYGDPASRRFGMELIACEQCGPQLHFIDAAGCVSGNNVWQRALGVLGKGGVVALQGFCGFHLLARAGDSNAVTRLRQWKARPAKPLALMVPSMQILETLAHVTDAEREWLIGPHRPIVLLHKRSGSAHGDIAPDNPYLGVMLPHNGIQHLILSALGEPVVATSANRRGEPVAADIAEVLPWLNEGVDAICHHDIPVWQAQDDSVMAVLSDGPLLLRRARGFAHEILPRGKLSLVTDALTCDDDALPVMMGEGAFLKNTVALAGRQRAVVSQYLGDLDNVTVARRKQTVTRRLLRACNAIPLKKATDAHPDMQLDTEIPVLHHHAHAAALIAETGLQPPALIATWDGIGYAGEQQWWGSEVFSLQSVGEDAMRLQPRIGLQPFALPGGDKCSREPWRVMMALLLSADVPLDQVLHYVETRCDLAAPLQVQRHVADALRAGVVFPQTTSMGRFLEALAVLLFGHGDNAHEAQAACRLEYAATASIPGSHGLCSSDVFVLPVHTDAKGVSRWQWQPMVRALWDAVQQQADRQVLARRVMDSMGELLVKACLDHVWSGTNVTTLGVSGGCFQNRYLLEFLARRCAQNRLTLVRPKRLPPNDGAISYGQLQWI